MLIESRIDREQVNVAVTMTIYPDSCAIVDLEWWYRINLYITWSLKYNGGRTYTYDTNNNGCVRIYNEALCLVGMK